MIDCLGPLEPLTRIRLHEQDPSCEVHMEDLDQEMTEELPGRSNGVEDAGEISGRVLEPLQRIPVTTRIRGVRVPPRRFGVLLAHEVAIGETLEAGEIAHRPPTVDKDPLYLHSPWCPHHEIAPLHPDRRDRHLDLVVVYMSC